MKIWFPTVRTNSGSDVYVINLSKALNELGVKTEITWLPSYFEFSPRFMCKIKAPEHFDLIHTNSWTERLTRDLSDKPTITTCHHWVHEEEKSDLLRFFYHKAIHQWEVQAFKNAHAVVSPGCWTLDKISHFCSKKTHLIPNWIELNNYRPQMQFRKASKNKSLLIVGKPSRRKGAHYLPELLAKIQPSIRIVLVCSLTRKTKKIVFPLMKKHNNFTVVETLPLSELIRKYNEAGALLNLSGLEGFGYTYAEAMACCKPVIGFRNKALDDMVEQEFSQLLVEYGNINKLVIVINNYFYSNKYSKLNMWNLRESIKNRYIKTNIVKQYISLYQSAIDATKSE